MWTIVIVQQLSCVFYEYAIKFISQKKYNKLDILSAVTDTNTDLGNRN